MRRFRVGVPGTRGVCCGLGGNLSAWRRCRRGGPAYPVCQVWTGGCLRGASRGGGGDGSEVRWEFSQCGGAAGPHCAVDSCLPARPALLTRAPAATCRVLPVPRLLLLLLLPPHSKYSYSANECRRCSEAVITLLTGTRPTFHLAENSERGRWSRVSGIVLACTLICRTLDQIEALRPQRLRWVAAETWDGGDLNLTGVSQYSLGLLTK
ncbi:hypothetical protein E2C01_023236 [Portunus trituberculatus]|uniref:Uncharacterized protein n=1 Tax=Portunus trituberculatus TaxID=210409 RepID=A0A5B7E7G8_PORTR|nr:hypothetical protein [Portunus trituberculatus]